MAGALGRADIKEICVWFSCYYKSRYWYKLPGGLRNINIMRNLSVFVEKSLYYNKSCVAVPHTQFVFILKEDYLPTSLIKNVCNFKFGFNER